MAAAAVPFVTIEEYLHSSFEVDMDYVDGALEERNFGERDHAEMQSILTFLFRSQRKEWGVIGLPELRVQVSPTRFRIPDVCVLPAKAKRTPVVLEAPLLCIEILSPEDRLSRTLARCEDYFLMGVRECWIFNPENRTALVLRPGGTITTHRQGALTLEGTPIDVCLADIFSVLDE